MQQAVFSLFSQHQKPLPFLCYFLFSLVFHLLYGLTRSDSRKLTRFCPALSEIDQFQCLAMVLFQRKLIYMGYIPPGTREEKLQDIVLKSKDFFCNETQIPSSNRVKLLALIMGKKYTTKPDCVVIYMQGNAGNPLHRIPVFTELLSSCKSISPIILAAAPRSYWRSTRRTPTQEGILADYRHVLRFAARRWPGTPLVLYGHSLGGAVTVCLLASIRSESSSASTSTSITASASVPDSSVASNSDHAESPVDNEEMQTNSNAISDADAARAIRGLVLENPFSSIPDMVRALYPQRWLPYRRLAPLVWDKWDALGAMRASSSGSHVHSREHELDEAEEARAEESKSVHTSPTSAPERKSDQESVLAHVARDMLVLVSERDEVVPHEMGAALYDARPRGGRARFVVIQDALHEDAWRQRQWAREVVRYLEGVSRPESER